MARLTVQSTADAFLTPLRPFAFDSGGTLYRVVLLLAFLYPSVLATWFDIA